MQQNLTQEYSEEQLIHKQISRLRLYNTFLIIIGLAISAIVIVTADATVGIILLTICWAIIGLIMVYFTGKIKNLNMMSIRTAPYSEPANHYGIPIYNVQPSTQQTVHPDSVYPGNSYVVNQPQNQPYVASPYMNNENSRQPYSYSNGDNSSKPI